MRPYQRSETERLYGEAFAAQPTCMSRAIEGARIKLMDCSDEIACLYPQLFRNRNIEGVQRDGYHAINADEVGKLRRAVNAELFNSRFVGQFG